METKKEYVSPETKVYVIQPHSLLDTQSFPEKTDEPISSGELDAKEYTPEPWPHYSVWDD